MYNYSTIYRIASHRTVNVTREPCAEPGIACLVTRLKNCSRIALVHSRTWKPYYWKSALIRRAIVWVSLPKAELTFKCAMNILSFVLYIVYCNIKATLTPFIFHVYWRQYNTWCESRLLRLSLFFWGVCFCCAVCTRGSFFGELKRQSHLSPSTFVFSFTRVSNNPSEQKVVHW